jgi:phage terminase Nu1 subunit (DNA packaging protein)
MSYSDELARLMSLQGDRAELRLMRERGEVISVEVEKQANITMITIIRSKMLGIPSKLASRFLGKTDAQRKGLLQKEVNECIAEWRHPV